MVKQFDVFANPSARSRETHPFVVVLQSDLTASGPYRVVAPLVRADLIAPPSRLAPEFTVEGQAVRLSPVEIGAAPVRLLTVRHGSLGSARDAIVGALDLLFTGI